MTVKFFKFILVGILNTIFGFSVFSLFIFLGMHYSIAALLGTIIGVLFNFKTTGKLVFGVDDNSRIIKFVGVYVIIYLLNVVGLRMFSDYKFNMYIAGLILILPMAVISFLLNKIFVFRES